MTMHVDTVEKGTVRVVVFNARKTLLLVFFLDYSRGKVHTNLEEGGLRQGENAHNEEDLRAYATFFYNVLGNGIAELTCGNLEPIDCEVVIPVNIIPQDPKTAIEEALARFRRENSRGPA